MDSARDSMLADRSQSLLKRCRKFHAALVKAGFRYEDYIPAQEWERLITKILEVTGTPMYSKVTKVMDYDDLIQRVPGGVRILDPGWQARQNTTPAAPTRATAT